MNKKGLSVLFFLLVAAAARAAQPSCCMVSTLDGLYLGIGFNQMAVRGDALESGKSGAGMNFIVGGRLFGPVSLDITVDALAEHVNTRPTTDIYYPADTAEYSTMRLALKFDLFDLSKEGWTPWISVGQVFAFLLWDTYFYNQDGSTYGAAFGVDKEFSPGWILRGRFSTFSMSTEDDYGHDGGRLGDTTFALSVLYEFGRREAEKKKPQSPAAFPPSN